MRITEKLQGKRILIWGMGVEGKSTEAFLRKYCEPAAVETYEGGREGIDEERFDCIVKSPGIRMDEDNGKYTSQTELFLEEFRDQVIGVTGTKGKSTTSSLLCHVLRDASERPVVLLGNIGIPCLDFYGEITPETIVVYEMSCHQLAHTRTSPRVAVFLNLYEEHLDYYGTVERYFQAKANITRYQREGDHLFLGEDVPELSTKAEIHRIREAEPLPLQAKGRHNQYNARFVYEIAATLFGCKRETVLESMSRFRGLPHRLENIGTWQGVTYYDDSISTIPEATIAAVNSLDRVDVVLIGGMDRGIHYEKLIDYIGQKKEIQFICMYDSGRRICEASGNAENVCYVEDLEQAVRLAQNYVRPGGACLLSPAAASYGFFKNFEERGNAFADCVRRIADQRKENCVPSPLLKS